ncbi:competence regulator inhibitor paratox [Streptococcus canis]
MLPNEEVRNGEVVAEERVEEVTRELER